MTRNDPDLAHDQRREDAAEEQRALFEEGEPERRRQAVKDARFQAAMLARKSRRILPYAPGSSTSEAAARAAREWDGSAREKVLVALDRHPAGLTDEEIAEVTGLSPNTARPRRFELAEMEIVVGSGTREVASGEQATVWVTFWHAEEHDRYGLAVHREHLTDRYTP